MGERYAAQVALDLSLDLGVSLSAEEVLADLVEQPWAGSFDLACLFASAAGTFARLGELRQARELVAQALEAMRPGGFPRGDASESQPGGDAYGDELDEKGDEIGSVAEDLSSGDEDGDQEDGSAEWYGAGAQSGDERREHTEHQSSPEPSTRYTQPGLFGSAHAYPSHSPYPYNPTDARDGHEYPDPLDIVGRSVPDQSTAQVKSRSLALAEVAYAATRIGELDLAREAGRLANDLAGRLEVSQAKRRLRALAPLLADSRRDR